MAVTMDFLVELTCTHFDDDLCMTLEARSSTIDHGHVRCNAHLVEVPPRADIVEGVEDDIELLEEVDIEPGVFDVRVIRFDLDIGIEFSRRLFCDLNKVQLASNLTKPRI
jgi:hypothetical protein